MKKKNHFTRTLALLLALCLAVSISAAAAPPPDGGGGPGGPGGPEAVVVTSDYFTDVTGDGVDAVDSLYEAGLIKGLDAATFGPDQSIRRGDFVLLLSRALSSEVVGESSFTDVSAADYYAAAIGQAVALGLITGDGNGTFRPQDTISRAEAIVILWRAASAGLIPDCAVIPGEGWSLDFFSDADQIPAWAEKAFASFAASDVLPVGEANPNADCTRLDMAVILSALLGTDRSAQQPPEDYDEVFVIVHTNDVHGYIQNEAYVKSVADYYASVYGEQNVITLSAGDVYAGGAAVAHYYQGEEIVKVMDAVGYDYVTPGNNDFNLENNYPGTVEKLGSTAKTAFLAANMYRADADGVSTGELVFDAYDIVTTAGGTQIGLFGLAMVGGGPRDDDDEEETAEETEEETVSYSYAARDDLAVCAEMVTELTDLGCGAIVAFGHKGWTDDIPDGDDEASALAQTIIALVEQYDPLPEDEEEDEDDDDPKPMGSYNSDMLGDLTEDLDVFIDGHSHSIIGSGQGWTSEKTGCLVTQAGEKGNNIGIVKIYLKDGDVAKATAQLLDSDDMACFTPDPAAQAAVDAAYARFAEDTAKPVGETPYYLNANRLSGNNGEYGIRTEELNLGDLVADAILWKTGAQAAFIGGVGLRASVEIGSISLGDWFGVFANGAEIVMLEMTGEELIEMLASGITSLPNETPSFNQLSGVKFSYQYTDDTVTVINPTVGGAAIDLEATYVVASGAMGQADSDSESVISGMEAMAEVMAEYMASEDCVIYPDVVRPDGRIVPIDEIPDGAAVYEYAKEDLME